MTDRHTEGTDFIPSNAKAGGKNMKEGCCISASYIVSAHKLIWHVVNLHNAVAFLNRARSITNVISALNNLSTYYKMYVIGRHSVYSLVKGFCDRVLFARSEIGIKIKSGVNFMFSLHIYYALKFLFWYVRGKHKSRNDSFFFLSGTISTY